MGKLKLKNKIISFIGIFAMLGACVASIFGGVKFSSSNNNSASATTDYSVYSNQVVSEIKADANLNSPEATYTLKKHYPILAEQQDKSNLCWAYSASKVLETTLMIATGEYYNFSEIATAYFAYKNGTNATINAYGSFEKFDLTIRTSGLVLESLFSNDIFYQINETNANTFAYVSEYANKNLAKQVVPIYLSNNTSFKTSNNQTNIIKNYIKNYGGLNIALPKNSMFRYDENTGYYTFDTTLNPNEGVSILENHAVCLIGWNEAGFVALNSWGVDEQSSYEEVVVPYDIMQKYYDDEVLFGGSPNNDWLCGYDYIGGETVILENSSAQNFSSTIVKNSSNPLKNVFCHTEAISLTFKINDLTNFDSIYVNVLKGTEVVTSSVSVSYDDANHKVTVAYTPTASNFAVDTQNFAGGSYAIQIFEDKNLISSRSFMIYTGTELAYMRLTNNMLNSNDSTYYSLMNNSASGANSDTFYICQDGSYTMTFYFTDISELSKAPNKNLMLYVREFQVYNYETGNFDLVDDSNLSSGICQNISVSSISGNKFEVFVRFIPETYVGKLIRFRICLISPVYGVSCASSYYFELFVSGADTASTDSDSYDIAYHLNGGRNNPQNIDVYPQYIKHPMPNFKLFVPTKTGYEFDGWYTDAELTTPITAIENGKNTGFLTLYAGWRETNDQYFSVDLTTSMIYNYNKEEVDLASYDLSNGATLTYGESIKLKATFSMLDPIKASTFAFKYYYYVNGIEVDVVDLITTNDMATLKDSYEVYFGGLSDSILAFPNLEVGTYQAEVVAVAVIKHNFSITLSDSYNITVQKKEVSINYNENASKFVYDGEEHSPSATFVGYYSEHAADFAEVKFVQNKKTNANTYKFNVQDIVSDNYYLKSDDKTREYLLVINAKQLVLNWNTKEGVYNGTKQAPKCTIEGLIGNDKVSITLDNEGFVNVGEYTFKVKAITNANYSISENQTVDFKIKPARVTVTFNNVEGRAQSATAYRTPLSYMVEGNLYDPVESLNITATSLGLTETLSGEYEINGSFDNDNYDVVFVPGVYTLTGYYYVYYTMPNGDVIEELVNYGETPQGITDEMLKLNPLQKLVYSTELVETGDDIYVVISVKDYTYYFVIGGLIAMFIIVYLVVSRKSRRNKVR